MIPEIIAILPNGKLRIRRTSPQKVSLASVKEKTKCDDTEESDLDLLVEPTNETTMMDIAKIQLELARLLNVAVDVLTPKALPIKFREQVIAEAQAL